MKKIKPEEVKRDCSWCHPLSVAAAWRSGGIGGLPKYACEDHRNDLHNFEKSARDDRMSEADYQTWARL